MKLAANSIIHPAKLTQYLLVKRERDDKSKWLASLGYTTANWLLLEQHLRDLLQQNEAAFVEANRFGDVYEIIADLIGPNGRRAAVRTIWIVEKHT